MRRECPVLGMPARQLRRPFPDFRLLGSLILLTIVFHEGCGSSPTQPTVSDKDATSCPGDILGIGSPAPTLRDIIPRPVFVFTGGTAVIDACFYRDKTRPADRAEITWSIADTTFATLNPQTGPTTTVSGKAVGSTTITAVITGVAVTTSLIVCAPGGRC